VRFSGPARHWTPGEPHPHGRQSESLKFSQTTAEPVPGALPGIATPRPLALWCRAPRPEAVRRKAAHAPFKLWSSCRARHDAVALHLHRRQRLPDCRIFILTHRVRAPHRTAPFKPLGSSSMDPGDWANQTSVSRALGDRHRSAAGARPARSPLCERARTSRGSAASRVIAPAATRSPPGLPSRDGAPRPPQWRR